MFNQGMRRACGVSHTPTLLGALATRQLRGRAVTIRATAVRHFVLHELQLVSYANVVVTSVRVDGFELLTSSLPAAIFDPSGSFGSMRGKTFEVTLQRIPMRPRWILRMSPGRARLMIATFAVSCAARRTVPSILLHGSMAAT